MTSRNRPYMKTPNLDLMLARLQNAIENHRSQRWKLRLWSEFIRARDAYRCIFCAQNAPSNPCIREAAAHHIIRRCILPIAEFDTGNGVTLCSRCHATVHSVSNRKPNLNEALNQRGGDDQDIMADLYGALEADAFARGILCDDFYFISESTLTFLSRHKVSMRPSLSLDTAWRKPTEFGGVLLPPVVRLWPSGSDASYLMLGVEIIRNGRLEGTRFP
jgi:hypothetical protein